VLEGESAYSRDGQYIGKAWLMRPYLLCIDAIQRCQLDTDHPKFPASPESAPADGETPAIQQTPDSEDDKSPRSKRSTVKGEARTKIISTWTLHHQYQDGGAENLVPLGGNELARKAGVSPGSVTAFFKDVFGSHTKYRSACHLKHPLLRALKEQNNDFSPESQYDPTLRDKRDDERDEDEADLWDKREGE
jgi:hypothetical protein